MHTRGPLLQGWPAVMLSQCLFGYWTKKPGRLEAEAALLSLAVRVGFEHSAFQSALQVADYSLPKEPDLPYLPGTPGPYCPMADSASVPFRRRIPGSVVTNDVRMSPPQIRGDGLDSDPAGRYDTLRVARPAGAPYTSRKTTHLEQRVYQQQPFADTPCRSRK